MIKKRAVFFVGGFDPKSSTAFFDRMDREIARFEALWGVDVSHQESDEISKDVTCTRYRASGGEAEDRWVSETDFHFVSLEDIVLQEFAKAFLVRFWRYLVTFFDYVISGTAFSIIRHGWRFSLYFFYPAVMIAISVIISWLLAGLIAQSGIQLARLAAPLVFLVGVFIFAQLLWKRYSVLHLMDLWSFSRDYLRNKNDAIDAKLNGLADLVALAARSGTYDEIIMVGHSTGGALILGAAAKAHQRHADFAGSSAHVTVLTVGSTALKVGLHPAAEWYRAQLGELFSRTDTGWVEYQCLTDVINFFRTNPARLMGIDGRMNHPMQIGEIRIKHMIDKQTYARIRRNFFRVHYQFVFGNTEKYHYDFPAICFGPAGLQERAQSPRLFKQSLVTDRQDTHD